MARKNDILYVRFQTDGSAARQLIQPAPFENTLKLPKVRRQKRYILRVDPVAIIGTVAAVSMLIMMVAGIFRLAATRQQMVQMEAYVQELSQENTRLQGEYRNGYDLESVERTARAMGMVPAQQIKQIPIEVELPQEEPAPRNFFERVTAFFKDLFA